MEGGEFVVDIRKNIAANIAKHRKLMKLSQKELAETIGVKSFTTVSSWERGGNIPDVETLFRLCTLFNISVDEMYGAEQLAKSVQALEATISYCKKIGYTVDERVIKWHWEDETESDPSKRVQIIDEAEFTLMKNGSSADFTQAEFEGLETGAKEAIEGRFYKKVLEQQKQKSQKTE